jgi:hypothetical protein
MQNNLSRYQVSPFNFPPNEQDKAFFNYIQNLENQIFDIEREQKKLKVDISHLPVLLHNRINNIPKSTDFFVKLLNEYLGEAYTGEEFVGSRYEFAKSGGKIFKEELELLNNGWNGSDTQKYINNLLKNLNEFTPFNIKTANNLNLESFAAFCQKGESDIGKLEDYLIVNEIGDFRSAFSLWGIVFGFANMPKTFTNELFLSKDSDYLTLSYKYIFKQLHDIELDGIIEIDPSCKSPIEINLTTKNPKTAPESGNTSEDQLNIEDIKSRLKPCKLKIEQLDNIAKEYERNQFKLNKKFFDAIKKIKGIGDKTIVNIQAALVYNKGQSSGSIHYQELSLFGNSVPELGKEFYKDPNIWSHLKPFIPMESQEEVKTQIKWIQESHLNNGYKIKTGGWNPLPDHSNSSVIKHFKNNAKNRIDPKVLEIIVAKLNEFYLK